MADPTLVTNPDLTAQIANLNTLLQGAILLLSQLLQGGTHLITGGMTAHVIQWLKNSRYLSSRWEKYSDTRKAVYSAAAAALPASGIVIRFSHPGEGHWILDADHLTLMTAAVFLWSFLQNWLWQQGWYMSVIKAKPVTGVTPTGTGSGAAPAPVGVVVEGVKP